jgi:hypothetical protein
LNSNATFRVTATGTAPLAYQWRLDGRELADATNASLVVSNVTLDDLGSYTVVVRDANGQAVSQSTWLKLARWTELVVFDASIREEPRLPGHQRPHEPGNPEDPG